MFTLTRLLIIWLANDQAAGMSVSGWRWFEQMIPAVLSVECLDQFIFGEFG
jgi:hypothetical protein